MHKIEIYKYIDYLHHYSKNIALIVHTEISIERKEKANAFYGRQQSKCSQKTALYGKHLFPVDFFDEPDRMDNGSRSGLIADTDGKKYI